MWYNELLFLLMIIALIGMGVMALIVKVNISSRKKSADNVKASDKPIEPERYPEPQAVRMVEEAEPDPEMTFEISETLFKPIIIQDAEPEPTTEPATEPLTLTPLEESTEQALEPQTEAVNEPSAEPMASPLIEEQAAAIEPEPTKTDLRREAENQFFDLRYEYKQQIITENAPIILDEAPSLNYEEEEEEEPVPGVVTCPHCKSEVPHTLYCIYCGNTLTAKPVTNPK